MLISNRAENQRLHILIFKEERCWYQLEYRFYPFASSSQLTHSNHTFCWINTFGFVVFVCLFFSAVCSSVKELCVRVIASKLLHQSFQRCPSNFLHHILFLVSCKMPRSMGYTPQIPLGWTQSTVKCICHSEIAHCWFKSELLWFGALGEEQQLISTVTIKGLRRQYVVTHEIQCQVPALPNWGWPGIKELYLDKQLELWISHSLICSLAHVYNMCKTVFPLPTTGDDPGSKNRRVSTNEECRYI